MESQLTIGKNAIAHIAGRSIEVKILDKVDGTWLVSSVKSGKTFYSSMLDSIEPSTEAAPEQDPEAKPEAVIEPGTESISETSKRLSLIDAACEVLKVTGQAMTAKELVKVVLDMKLWMPRNGKTPEQSLYGAIFHEMKTAPHSRFKRSSTRKSAFEFNA